MTVRWRSRIAAAIAALSIILAAGPAPAHAESFQRSRAIVVGIDTYKNPELTPLTNAVVDAERVAQYLRDQKYEVVLLVDATATRERIITELRRAARELGASDRLLFFFGGHGYTDTAGGREYGHIIPSDGVGTASFISMEELQGESDRMRHIRHQLFIMNSCYGGTIGILPRTMSSIASTAPAYLDEITRREARQFITAGGPKQVVLDGGPGGLSYFAHYFLEATARGEADLNRDGVITFGELAAYLVPRASNRVQTPAYGMLPGHGMGEYVFRPATAAASQQVAATAPPSGTTTATRELSSVARSFPAMQKPIDDLYDAWATLDLRRYLAQWAPDAVQFVGRNRRTLADIRQSRERLFGRLTSVNVERYQLWYRGFHDGVGHFDASYSMTFRYADGRVVSERERESYKVRQVGGRWLIVENQDYKR